MSPTWKSCVLICGLVVLMAGCSRDARRIVQSGPELSGSTFESTDGNLVVDGGDEARDWVNAPNLQVKLDGPTGKTDDAFGKGSKEDTESPTVVSGSIPNNKSDLTRFYVAREGAFVYVAWERENTLGSANMDFEFNQSAVRSANGVTPVRTEGDILITFDFTKGGSKPVLGLLSWVTSEPSSQCYAGNSVPCWGNRVDLSASDLADGAVNEVTDVVDPVPPDAPRTLPVNTFGEAAINLELGGFLPPAPACKALGSAFLKSRSSASFTAELKDFIAPALVDLSNCSHADIVLRKVDGSGNPLAGAVLQLFIDTNGDGLLDAGDRQIGEDCTTGADGLCTFEVTQNGTYIAHELSPPEGYQKASDQTATVTLTREHQTITLTIVNQLIALDLAKTVDKSEAVPGDALVYTVEYSNPGDTTLTNVTLTDTLPSGTTFESLTALPAIECATPSLGGTGTITCLVGDLAPGASGTMTIGVKLDTVFPSGSTLVTNTATIDSAETTPRSASATTTVSAAPALSIQKTGPASATPGSAITYSIVIANSGTATATGVTLSDPSPAGVTLTSASSTAGSCSVSSGIVSCTLGSLSPGGSVTVTVTGTVASVFPATSNIIHNVATVDSSETEPQEASADTSVAASPSFSFTKSAVVTASTTTVTNVASLTCAEGVIASTGNVVSDSVAQGAIITYTLAVANGGSTAATDLVVTDPLPEGASLCSASDGGVLQSGAVVWTISSLAVGSSTQRTMVVRVGGGACPTP